MAATITPVSANLNNGCMLTNKAITFELDGFADELTESGPWQIEVTVSNLADDTVIFGPQTVFTDIVTAEVDDQGYALSIDLPGAYRFTARVYMLDGDEQVVQEVSATIDFTLCPSFSVIKDNCYKYHLWRPSGDQAPTGDPVYQVTLKNMSGSYEADIEWDTAVNNQLQFSLPGDDVYQLTMSQDDTVIYEFFIHEYCRFMFCFGKLITDLMCGKLDDPCCKDCTGEIKKNLENIRLNLNKIMALAAEVMLQTNSDQLKYLGVFCVNDCRQLENKELAEAFTSLTRLTTMCGAGCGQSGCEEEFVASCGCQAMSLMTTVNLTSPTVDTNYILQGPPTNRILHHG